MPIRYLGIDIGQIQSLELITAKNEVQAKAVLYPEYVGTFARAGTRFSVITPQISAAGVEHLDTLFQAYINVEPAAARHDAILRSRIRRSAIRVISTALTSWWKRRRRVAWHRYAGPVPRTGSRDGYRTVAGVDV